MTPSDIPSTKGSSALIAPSGEANSDRGDGEGGKEVNLHATYLYAFLKTIRRFQRPSGRGGF